MECELRGQMQLKPQEALTTWRDDEQVISTDPRGMTGGDTTRWEYNDASGLEVKKTYADGRGSSKTYDAANRLATEVDARGIVAQYTYNKKTGLVTGVDWSTPDTPAISCSYNILGQPTEIKDAGGRRVYAYDQYGSLNYERSFYGDGDDTFAVNEEWDSYGRSIGYRSRRSGSDMTVVSFAYAADGRIESASFRHGGEERKFTYGYLAGSNLLQSLAMPNKVTLTQTWEEKRDLLAEMLYTRLNSAGNKVEVTRRGYAYDALGRPISRTQDYPQQKFAREDSFDYNKRSELTGATLGEAPYAYSYDNIGNRITAQEDAQSVTYEANNLNQYTQIDTDGTVFVPEYDADGNQTRIQTVTGIWKVQYNGQNRAIRYESEADSTHIITCVYDSQGRRVEKKEEKEGAVISHVRYVYRGYLQVAAYDLLAEGLPSLWQIIWDPTQDIATRPLAIRADGAYSTYGWDLTKNICETYAGATGFLGHRYAYSPYGLVSLEGDTSYQPLQWSSEVYDEELGLNYYNYRYYNPGDGRWTRKDLIRVAGRENAYCCLNNCPVKYIDRRGLDVWIENTDQMFGLHQRICVDTWVQDNSLQSKGSNGVCCMNGRRWKKSDKYCISFGTQVGCWPYFSSGDGGSSDSDSSGPDASSSANEQHTPNTGQSHFPEGIEGPTPNSNGVVYIDIIDPATGESGRIKTSCQQDITSKEYLEGLVGQEAEYSLLGQTCRDFSWAVHDYLKKLLKQGK